VQSLGISNGESALGHMPGHLPSMVMATILGSQCGSLRALTLMAEHVGLGGAGFSALAALTGLRSLDVRYALRIPIRC